MKHIYLIIIIIGVPYYSFIKGTNFSAHVEDAIEDSQILNLFRGGNMKEDIKDIEKKLGGINFDYFWKQINRKKVLYHFQDESTNTFLNGLVQYKSYQLLCLGNITLSVKIQSKLKCQYVDRGVPFLKIAPFKEEEAYLDPRIVIFHDVLYEEEIDTIKRLALPEMQRATFLNHDTGKEESFDFRITDTAWLDREDHQVVESVYRRVQFMTGLSLETAELLQTAYYPVKGKYEPHYDFQTQYPQFEFSQRYQDRLATVLFYLSNVEEGGATVFTKLDVTLTPKKGNAAFWYNLKSNGNRDYLTQHAACPVISGSKWAANLWISEAWQEFHHPCTLDNQPYDEEWEQLYLLEENVETEAQNVTLDRLTNTCENTKMEHYYSMV